MQVAWLGASAWDVSDVLFSDAGIQSEQKPWYPTIRHLERVPY